LLDDVAAELDEVVSQLREALVLKRPGILGGSDPWEVESYASTE
jgi:hypothetical protein